MNDTPTLAEIREGFIEKMGVISQGEGFTRITGRVLALLVFEGEAVSFGDLAGQLGVSRGSISAAVRTLEERLVIKRISKPGIRQDFFLIEEGAFERLLGEAATRARDAQAEIDATIALLPIEAKCHLGRLQIFSDFYRAVEGALKVAEQRLSGNCICGSRKGANSSADSQG
ncbi:MAG: DNA-binding transcriptional regulator GbsR (MarR family) [Halocynthiibacter sp.]|jgi:DNA-binding transcriptional regulator GbsR (MarR family)